MAIRCSVLGHDFGDPERERERVERGEEVIVTVREIETCRNCGETRTVSESKEVTAAGGSPPESVGGTTTDATADPTTDPAASAPPDATTRDANARDTGGPGGHETTPETDTGSARSGDPDTDSDTRDAPPSQQQRAATDRDTGDARVPLETHDSPESTPEDGSIEYDLDEAVHADDPATDRTATSEGDPTSGGDATPDRSSATNGPGAERSAGDAGDDIDRIEATAGSSASRERAHGEWPAEPGSDADRATGSGASAQSGDSTGWDAPLTEEAVDREWSPPGEDASHEERIPASEPTEGDLVCPSCGFAEPVTASALRAGDICPACQRGYLAWETRKG